MNTHVLDLSPGRLTRIGYLDVPVPAELLGLTEASVNALDWAAPTWAQEGQPLLGAAAWVGDFGGRRLAFDPLQTLDVLLRPDADTERTTAAAVAERFAAAGFPIESFDQVILSHIDGIGMTAVRDDSGAWVPYFPDARILLSDTELDGFLNSARNNEAGPADQVRDAWLALIDAGCVDTYTHGEAIAPGIVAEVSGGHGPGHTVIHFQGTDEVELSLIGHLAVSAVHLATGECEALNEDPATAWRLLHDVARDGRRIAGALWPAPGAGRWLGDAGLLGSRESEDVPVDVR